MIYAETLLEAQNRRGGTLRQTAFVQLLQPAGCALNTIRCQHAKQEEKTITVLTLIGEPVLFRCKARTEMVQQEDNAEVLAQISPCHPGPPAHVGVVLAELQQSTATRCRPEVLPVVQQREAAFNIVRYRFEFKVANKVKRHMQPVHFLRLVIRKTIRPINIYGSTRGPA